MKTSLKKIMPRRSGLMRIPVLLAALALSVHGEDKPATPPVVGVKPNQVRGDEITDKQKLAVAKGLEWLARSQQPDGSYSKGASGAGITGLAGLAFMSAGNLPGRG